MDAELLTANLQALSRGMEECALEDWYSEGAPRRRIALDPRLGPQQNAERLFERSVRGSARPTDGEASNGLGLYLVRRVIQDHGGTVTATSEGIGHGSTFRFSNNCQWSIARNGEACIMRRFPSNELPRVRTDPD